MKFEDSKRDGHHSAFGKIAGKWSGTTKAWFEPDVLADESEITGTIRPILRGRFLLHEYAGSFSGKDFEGLAIYGFDLATGRFQSAWVDSFHMSTAIMFSDGDDRGKFDVTGSYFAGEGHPNWGWRTEIGVIDDDNIVITSFNISPDGEEAKATETRYSRQV